MVNQEIQKELKQTVGLSLPLIGSWLIYSFSGFIGTAMVGHLGKDALAASVLTNTLWLMISVFFFGIYNSISVLVSHEYGARNYNAIGEIVGQGLLLGVASFIPITCAMLTLPLILNFTGQSQAVLTESIAYSHALLWSVPGMLLLVVFEHFFNGIGMTKLSLFISLIEVPIEIFFIYIFVFGKCGLPAFGLPGVGYGLALSYTLTILVLLVYVYASPFMKKFLVYNYVGLFIKQRFFELIRLGLPVGVMYLVEVGSMFMATFLMAQFSAAMLAAHQIVVQYLGFTINAAFAVAQAVSIRIGHNIGRQQLSNVQYACYSGIALSVSSMFLMAMLYLFIPKVLLQVDLNIYLPANFEVVKQATTFLAILAIFQVFDSLRIVSAGALRGLKDTRAAMYISVISFWGIGISSSYVLGFVFGMQGTGIWIGLLLGVMFGAVIIYHRLKSQLAKLTIPAESSSNALTI